MIRVSQLACRAATVALIPFTVGCASLRANTAPRPADAWPVTLANAKSRATEGNFTAADSLLAAFAAQYPGATETLETAYWRALFRMDPTNPNASLTVALASLDGYLADTRKGAHAAEAASLRRVAGQLDSMTLRAANALAQAKDATNTAKDAKAQAADARAEAAKAADTPPATDAELKRVKDELAKANAELDRIRKRLAQPPPKPPV